MSVFGSINVVISAAIGGLAGALQSALAALGRFTKSVLSSLNPVRLLGSVLRSTFGQLALFSGADAIVSSLRGMAGEAAETVDSLSKLSRRLGTTYAELAALKLAGDLAGVGIESIAAAMTKADVAMQKAAGGSRTAQAAFATLGLAAEQLQGMSSADRFQAIASAIAGLQTPAERAAAAVALFGRSGAQLLPLFEGGADSIARTTREAERFGLTLTNAQAQNVEEMNDSFTRVYESIRGVVQQVVAHLAPAITGIAKQFTDMVGNIGGATIGQRIGDGILQGARFLAQVGDYLIASFPAVFQYLARVGQGWNDVFSQASQIAAAFAAVGRVLSTAFLLIVRIALTPLMNVVEQVARLASNIPGIGRNAEMVAATVAGFREGLDQSVKDNAKAAGENFENIFKERGPLLGELAAGQLTQRFDEFIAASKAAASAIDEKSIGVKKALETPTTVQVQVNSAALKAIVAGTSEGEAFANSLLRGADPRKSNEANHERTADATERAADGIDELASILQDQLALAEISV